MGTNVLTGGNPPIVFISQLGNGGGDWDPVLDRLGCGSTTVTYDRPGTGGAPGRPAPNPPLPHGTFAQELADLLDAEGVTEPAVIVAHSFGGNIAKVYAGRWPGRVAGLVFVDSSVPQTFLWPRDHDSYDGDGPGATRIDTVTGQVEILSSRLPPVPAVVVVRAPNDWKGLDAPPGTEDLWQLSQRLLAQQISAPLVVMDSDSHQIPEESPDLVAYVVDAVVEAVRVGGRAVTLNSEHLAAYGGHLEQ